MEIDPETVWYGDTSAYGGTANLDQTDLIVTAAEHANGYVFMAAQDGYLYVAPTMPERDQARQLLCRYHSGDPGHGLQLCRSDPVRLGSGQHHLQRRPDFRKAAAGGRCECYLSQYDGPRGLKLTGLTIDDNGTFYVLNHNSNECYLYRFTLDQIVDGAFITGLAPINNTDDGSTGYFGYYGCLAWEHDKDILYMTSGVTPTYNSTSYLVQLDPETGKGTKVNTTYVDNPAYDPATCGSMLNDVVVGLYIVPSSTGSILSSTEAMGVALDQTEVQCLRGATFTPDPLVLPMEPDQLRCHLDQLRRDGSHCGRWCGHHGGRWHCHHHSHHGGQAQLLRHL